MSEAVWLVTLKDILKVQSWSMKGSNELHSTQLFPETSMCNLNTIILRITMVDYHGWYYHGW